jgi:hypothetical protein
MGLDMIFQCHHHKPTSWNGSAVPTCAPMTWTQVAQPPDRGSPLEDGACTAPRVGGCDDMSALRKFFLVAARVSLECPPWVRHEWGGVQVMDDLFIRYSSYREISDETYIIPINLWS